MPLEDLDLEFEDEDEASRKKEAVDVDVDLEFQAPEGMSNPRLHSARPPTGGQGAAAPKPTSQKPAPVRNISDARSSAVPPKKPPSSPTTPSPSSSQSPPRTSGSSALKHEEYADYESQELVDLRAQMQNVQLEAQVKVSVAEFKTEFLTEMLSDMKLASYKIEQLLVRINAKHPDMKNEVLMIKKILAEFVAKKRK